jgi:hypothetical protein
MYFYQSLPGNGSQRRTIPLLWVAELFPSLSYQILKEQQLTANELQFSD